MNNDYALDALVSVDQVFFVIHSVASSGMSRVMSAYVIANDDLVCLDGLFIEAGGCRRAKDRGFRVHGCGMDMRFHALNSLAFKLGLGRDGNSWGIRSL